MSQPEAGPPPDPTEQPQGSSRPPASQPSPPTPKHTRSRDLSKSQALGGNAYTAGEKLKGSRHAPEKALEENFQGSEVEEFDPLDH